MSRARHDVFIRSFCLKLGLKMSEENLAKNGLIVKEIKNFWRKIVSSGF